eukprot:GHVQ01029399.1.p4 GENE.GHVQ01029399.1~~GHVQ01029399.1.p4  ORF type:complete len:138 (-),score=22.31 GHVQ01029399.1:174-587(-)
MIKAVLLEDENLQVERKIDIRRGDLVVHHLTKVDERKAATEVESNGWESYTAEWSLPQRVVKIQEGAAELAPLKGQSSKTRRVPIARLRRVYDDVSPSLAKILRLSYAWEARKEPRLERETKRSDDPRGSTQVVATR